MNPSDCLIDLSTPRPVAVPRPKLNTDFTPSLTQALSNNYRKASRQNSRLDPTRQPFPTKQETANNDENARNKADTLLNAPCIEPKDLLKTPVKRQSLKRAASTPNTPREVCALAQRRRIALQDKSNAPPTLSTPIGKASARFVEDTMEVEMAPLPGINQEKDTDNEDGSESDTTIRHTSPLGTAFENIRATAAAPKPQCSCETPTVARLLLEKEYDATLYKAEIAQWQETVQFMELEKKFGL